ncbi:MAG: B12-binding domain-containing radical SAM protein, partial [Nevskiales bacterium]
VADRAQVAFAQFVMLTPFPGTVDFARWEKTMEENPVFIGNIPLTRRWLIPPALRPKLYWQHPVMSTDEIRDRTQSVWDTFYSLKSIWNRSSFIKSKRGRLAFCLISKIYRQMYADTGIATDSARIAWSARWARWLAKPCRLLFSARPMPDLQVPAAEKPECGDPRNLVTAIGD